MDLIRNETTVTIGGEKILVRAEFDSLRKFEQAVGGMGAFIAPIAKTGAINMTDGALLVFHTQAPENQVKYTLEQIFNLIFSDGIESSRNLMQYTAMITAGNKRVDGLGDTSKKELPRVKTSAKA